MDASAALRPAEVGGVDRLLFASATTQQREDPQDLNDPGAWQDPPRVRELIAMRTAKSKTYRLASGQREWVSNDEVIHYKDDSGAW